VKTVIIDYGMGNLASVYNAMKFLGGDIKVSSASQDIKDADKLILPGVGGFRDTMEGLDKRGLLNVLQKAIREGKIYLGICLGLQILFEKSEEGNARGLGIFKGSVRKFQKDKGLKIPHIGWNSVDKRQIIDDKMLLDGIRNYSYFYFVHSYYADPEDKSIIEATTNYGARFASCVWKDNIHAVQFHPERSQEIGLKMLKNFIEL